MRLITYALLTLISICGTASAEEWATEFEAPLHTIQLPDEWQIVIYEECDEEDEEAEELPDWLHSLSFELEDRDDVELYMAQIPLRDPSARLDTYAQELVDSLTAFFTGKFSNIPTLFICSEEELDEKQRELDMEEWDVLPELLSVCKVSFNNREWVRFVISDVLKYTVIHYVDGLEAYREVWYELNTKCIYSTLLNGYAYGFAFSCPPEEFEELEPLFDATMQGI